jgi:uncharacterized membrane protein
MVTFPVIASLIVAVLVYGNYTLVPAAEIQHVPFLILFAVAVAWPTIFLSIFLIFLEKIMAFFSRYKFFRNTVKAAKAKAKKYHNHTVIGVILSVVLPLPVTGLHCGSIIGMTLGFSKLKTFIIVWLANFLQFLVIYAVVHAVI